MDWDQSPGLNAEHMYVVFQSVKRYFIYYKIAYLKVVYQSIKKIHKSRSCCKASVRI